MSKYDEPSGEHDDLNAKSNPNASWKTGENEGDLAQRATDQPNVRITENILHKPPVSRNIQEASENRTRNKLLPT